MPGFQLHSFGWSRRRSQETGCHWRRPDGENPEQRRDGQLLTRLGSWNCPRGCTEGLGSRPIDRYIAGLD
jgi:hypothetical protein